jgi:NAD(P)-dependent dehydrogenase (short-subunit alcohol dehydrogenase family)
VRASDATDPLRAGLLEGVAVLIAGPPEPSTLAAAVSDACAALGGSVSTGWALSARSELVEEPVLDEAVAAVVGGVGRIDLLAVDGAGLFAHGFARDGSGHAALRACMDAAWNVTRATVDHAFLATSGAVAERATGGGGGELIESHLSSRRIVYLAPAPDAGEYARAACAGLENLGRTLSIEWARHGITTVTIAPGEETPAGEVAALTAYLASPAGAYFSGCLLDLRGP